jgi:DNA polymerase I-like protein with 3'-5' exonuclease and polymerase domains
MPPYDHPDRKKIQGGIERQGKNAGIQGSNADTIKEAMVLLVDRLKPYDARLILTVHDEVVVEVKNEQKYEVSGVVSQALVDGFGKYFDAIPMETDTLIGPCWLKDGCENEVKNKKCGCVEMKFAPHPKMGTRLVCSKCGAGQE